MSNTKTKKYKLLHATSFVLMTHLRHSVPDGTPFLLNLSVFKPQWMEEQENTPGLKIKNKKVSL